MDMVKGIDVSGWNPHTDWAQVKKLGYSFAFIKATEGTSYRNPRLAQDWANTQAFNVTRGAYHFFHNSDDPLAQAKLFIMVMNAYGLHDGDLLPALDWEESIEGKDAAYVSQAIANVKTFLDEIEKFCGHKPFIYCSPGYIEDMADILGEAMPSWLADYPLWIAHYDVAEPRIPAPWEHYAIWQNRVGSMNGMEGEYDFNQLAPDASLSDCTLAP